MIVTPLADGIVLDHINAGLGIRLYNILKLDELSCPVALILNADSAKLGKKDIIKIGEIIDLDFTVLGYIDPGITVNFIRDGKVVKREPLELPERVTDVIRCKNPRCITTTEQELSHIFKLTDRKNRVYRCIYCESRAKQ